MDNLIVIIVVMATYITLLVSWGVYQGRKVKTGNDYAIAGRSYVTPARLTTFIFSLLTAIIATFAVSPERISRPSRP